MGKLLCRIKINGKGCRDVIYYCSPHPRPDWNNHKVRRGQRPAILMNENHLCVLFINSYILVSVCVCERVLHHFQQSFSHITTVAACCMRRGRCQHGCNVTQTQDTNTPPSHIILTLGQPALVVSSSLSAFSEETTRSNFNIFGLARPDFEPATSQLRGERSIHSAT